MNFGIKKSLAILTIIGLGIGTALGLEYRNSSKPSASYNFRIFNTTGKVWSIICSEHKMLTNLQPNKPTSLKIDRDCKLKLSNNEDKKQSIAIDCFSAQEPFLKSMKVNFEGDKQSKDLKNEATRNIAFINGEDGKAQYKVTISNEHPDLNENTNVILRVSKI